MMRSRAVYFRVMRSSFFETRAIIGIGRRVDGLPIVGRIARIAYRRLAPARPFDGSESYWLRRYRSGGHSGDGSYGQLSRFKADVVNAFVDREGIASVMELGCGDGNQLSLARYPRYLGFDVSAEAIARCRSLFIDDRGKEFRLMKDYRNDRAELVLSLDVIYHLVEDDIYHDYMGRLFESADRFVIIYSSNTEVNAPSQAEHVRHRRFTDWISLHRPTWELREHIANRYPYDGDTTTGSFADFFVFSIRI